MSCGLPMWSRTATVSGRSDAAFNISRSSRASLSRRTSVGYELPSFVATIIHFPLLRRSFDKPNCKSPCLMFLANGDDGSRRTCTMTGGGSSLFLQVMDRPRTSNIPKRKHSPRIKPLNKSATSTSAANPPAPLHRARGNTWPARDTSAPRLRTSHKPRYGRKHARPAWCAARRYKPPQRSPS